MTKIQIMIRDTSLTDGSAVYDVKLRHPATGDYLKFPAIDYSHAKELCAKLAEAIESHTNIEVESDH